MDHRYRHDPSKTLVGFSVGQVQYAVPIGRVKEIANPISVVPLPHAPRAIMGVADYRGEVVPVVDLRIRFGLPPSGVTRRTKWIVVVVAGRLVALVVDSVTEVFGTAENELRPPPQVAGDDIRGIEGVTTHEGQLVFVLGTERLRDVTDPVASVGPFASGRTSSPPRRDPHVSEAAAAVRWLLQQAEPEARRVAVKQIAKVQGPAATDLVMAALADDDWRVRKEGAAVAPAIEPRAELVAALIAALDDKVDIGLRNAAVEALVAIGADAVGPAVQALADLDPDGRKLAIEVLGGVPDVRGAEALARALHDEDANVRASAAEALGGAALAGEEARSLATRALVSVLSSSDSFVKIAALDALGRLEARLPWTLFEPYTADPVLRRYAIAAASASREPEALAVLARAAADASPTVSREAIAGLGDVLAVGFDDPLPRAGYRARAQGADRRSRQGVRRRSSSRARRRRLARQGGPCSCSACSAPARTSRRSPSPWATTRSARGRTSRSACSGRRSSRRSSTPSAGRARPRARPPSPSPCR